VVALTAYFDASGHPDQGKQLVVCGWLSFEPRWRQFERAWQKALNTAEVQTFHMKDFAASRGEFSGWKYKEKKRAKFLERLVSITVEHVAWSFAAVVVLDDWRKANARYMLEEQKLKPYPLCGHTCVDLVRIWCDEHGYDKDHVVYWFERGDKDQGMLRDRVFQDFGVEVHFEGKQMLPLQAADFAAWEELKIMGENPKRLSDVRRSFGGLFGRVSYTHQHFSLTPTSHRPPSLVRYCQDMNVPERIV